MRTSCSIAHRLVAPSCAVLSLAALAHGQTISWANGSGGAYRLGTNWTGSAVPGSGNDALFALASPYTVTFAVQNEVNSRAIIRDGEVTFDLSGKVYTLAFNFDYPAPSLVLGDTASKTGKLNVKNGRLDARQISIAYAAHTGGRLTVDAGGTVRHNSTVYVGGDGDGIVNITSGGTMSRYSDNDRGWVYIGAASGSGAVNIDGAGSSWTTPGPVAVGGSGQGILNLTNGGSMTSYSGGLYIGQSGGSSGEAVISGENSLFHQEEIVGAGLGPGSVVIGQLGTGKLTLSEGAELDGYLDTIGTYEYTPGPSRFRGNGTALITGAGTKWTNRQSLTIGYQGDGDLTLSDGAEIESGTVYASNSGIAVMPGSTGDVLVTGAGSRWTIHHTLDIARDYSGNAGGTGSLTVADSGTVQADTLRLGPGATVIAGSVTIGTVTARNGAPATGLLLKSLDGAPGATIKADSLTIGEGGVITGQAAITADLFNSGELDPDGDFPVTGDFTMGDGGVLKIALGLPTYDRVLVDGAAALDGTLELSLLEGYTPAAGDSFDIVKADSSTGQFSSIVTPAAPLRNGLWYDVVYSDTFVRVSVIPGAPAWAMLAGAAGAGLRRRRTHRTTDGRAWGEIAEPANSYATECRSLTKY